MNDKWKMVKLGDVCELVMGTSPEGNTITENPENGIEFHQGKTFFGEKYLNFSNIYTTSPVRTAKSNSVIMSVRAPVGDTNITERKIAIGRGLCSFNLYDKCDRNFFFYFLNNNIEYLKSKSTGSTFKAVSKDVIQSLQIPLPSLETQKQIAANLDQVTKVIAEHKELLAKYDLLLKSRFIEMFGDEKHFERIGNNAKLQGGYAFKSKDITTSGVRLVQIGNVNKDNLTWNETIYVPKFFLEKYSDFVLKEHDIVLAMTRPIIKSLNEVKIATVSNEDAGALLNQRVGKFVLLNQNLNPTYLLYCCKTNDFKLYVEKMSGNSLQPNISSKQVEDYEIPVPPLPLQNQFAGFVQQIDSSKAVVQQSLQKAETLYKSLMQEYFG